MTEPAVLRHSPHEGGARRRRRSGTGLSRSEWIVTVLMGLTWISLLPLHGLEPETAYVLASGLFGLLLIGLWLGLEWVRRALSGARGLGGPALCLLVLLLAALLNLTAMVPAGPHPIWSIVGEKGAGAINRTQTWLSLVLLGGVICSFLIGVALGDGRRRGALCLSAIVCGGMIYGCWAFIDNVVAPDLHAFGRMSAGLLSPNVAGSVFGMLTILAMAMMFVRLDLLGADRRFDKMMKALALPLAAAMIAGTNVLLTQSRGALAVTGLCLCLLLIWEGVLRRSRSGVGAGAVAVILLLALAIPVLRSGIDVAERSTDLSAGSLSRMEIWEAHWQMVRAAPWMGYGLGSFDDVNQMVLTSANYASLWNVHSMHNFYLQWIEEAGIIGAGALFLAIALVLKAILAGAAYRGEGVWLRGVFVAGLAVLLHGVSDFALSVPAVEMLWAGVLGVGFALSQAIRQTGARKA